MDIIEDRYGKNESRLKDPKQLEEAIRMFYAGTLPYKLVYNSDKPIDLEAVKTHLVKI